MVTYKTMIKSNYRKLANTLFFPSPLSAIDVQQCIEENINDLEVSPLTFISTDSLSFSLLTILMATRFPVTQ